MLKKALLFLLATLSVTSSLYAASAWLKPYSEWTDEDRKKVANDSPWGDRHKFKTGLKNGGPSEADLWLAWQSALPIKQLLYGRAAILNDATARQLLERAETVHVLRVTDIPAAFGDLASEKEALIKDTVLRVMGKPDIHPVDVQQPGSGGGGRMTGRGGAKGPGGFGGIPQGAEDGFGKVNFNFAPQRGGGGGGGGGRGGGGGGGGFGGRGGGFGGGGGGSGTFDLYFVFAKDAPISADDKEFEFATKIGKMEVHHKYTPKDMMFQGKLEW